MFYDLNKKPKVLSTLSKPSRNTRQTFKNDKVCDSTILNRSIRAHLCPTETFHCFDCRRLPYLSLLEQTKKNVSSNDACVIPKKIKFAENGCFTCVVLRLKHRFHSKDRISIRVSPMFVKSRMSAGNIYYLFIAVFFVLSSVQRLLRNVVVSRNPHVSSICFFFIHLLHVARS